MAINVPPIGVNKGGVKKAIPNKPNLDQIVTILLLEGVKTLDDFFLNRPKKDFKRLPKKDNDTTVVIIPAKQVKKVGQNPNFKVNPKGGPNKNLAILIKNTGITFKNSSILTTSKPV